MLHAFKQLAVLLNIESTFDLLKREQLGLTSQYQRESICEHCGINLKTSNYRDQNIVYSISSKRNSGFYCLVCVKNKKAVTVDDLDKYLTNIFITKFMQTVFG